MTTTTAELDAVLVLSATEREITARNRLIQQKEAHRQAAAERREHLLKNRGIRGRLFGVPELRNRPRIDWEGRRLHRSKEEVARLSLIADMAKASLANGKNGTVLMAIEDFAMIRGSWVEPPIGTEEKPHAEEISQPIH